MKKIPRQYQHPHNRVVRRGYVRNFSDFNALADVVGTAAAMQAEPPAGLLMREYSHRAASIESEFAVPLFISTVNAAIAAVAAVAVGYLARSDYTAAAAVLIAAATFGTSFYQTTKRQLDSIWTREEYGEEVIEPASAPALPAPPSTVHIEIAEKRASGTAMKFLDLPITDQQLARLAIHLHNGGTFSRDATAHIFAGKEQYPETKRILTGAGLLREVDRKGTVELTSAGKSLFAKVLP